MTSARDALHTRAFSDDADDRRVLRGATGRWGAVVLGRRLPDLDRTFVTTGLSDAVTAARERAEAGSSTSGGDPDVVLVGGGATVGSALAAGLVDALTLHLAPVVPGDGTPLPTGGAPRALVQRTVIATPTATHLTDDVL